MAYAPSAGCPPPKNTVYNHYCNKVKNFSAQVLTNNNLLIAMGVRIFLGALSSSVILMELVIPYRAANRTANW